MYSSYYAPRRNLRSQNSQFHNIGKSSSQYLFLNKVRMFSIVYLLLTIFYIPLYLGISQVNSLYWKQQQINYTFSQAIFLQGTIFAIKKYQSCFQSENQFKKLRNETEKQQILLRKDGKYCFVNKVKFLPFVKTVEEFNTFYFSYFLVFYLVSVLAVMITDHMNKKLFIQLEYPQNRKNRKQKLQSKKIFHVMCQMNENIYFQKSILKNKLQKLFPQNQKIQIGNIKLCLDQNFRRYVQLHLQSKRLQQKLLQNRNGLLIESMGNIEMNDVVAQILKDKQKLEKMNFEMSLLLIKIKQVLRNKQNYHYGHYWVHLKCFKDCLEVQKFIFQSKKEGNYGCYVDNTIESDLLIQNIENRQIIGFLSSIDKNWNEQFWTQFRPNNYYKKLNKALQVFKVVSGCLICIILIIVFDVVILIIRRTQIFSYPTILVVLVLQIILKILINKLSQLERHSRYSHLKLSIMLKLSIFIFVNLVVVLFIGTYDLGQLPMGRMLSSYELNEINQKWFLIIGTNIILTVLTQIVFCNVRVYIQVLKNILLKFLQKRLFSILRLNRLKQRLKIWIDELKQNYHKPMVDLQVCYSQILPVYMIGIVFGYVFPIMYPLLFIFSITIHYTHQNYIEYQTQKFLYNGMLLNDWAYKLIYVSFLGGLCLVTYIQWQNRLYIFILFAIICLLFISKYFLSNIDQMIIKKLQQLSKSQNHHDSPQKLNQYPQTNYKNSQRQFQPQTIPSKQYSQIKSKQQSQIKSIEPQIKQIKTQFIQKQLTQKQIQLKLLSLFGSQYQNVNQIHSHYYQKYQQTIQKEIQFLKNLQQKFKKQK